MSRNKHRRQAQPTTLRAMPAVPAGARLRPIRQQGPYTANQYGANEIPAATLNAPMTMNGSAPTTFLPGDPVRATPGLDDGQGGPRAWVYPVGTNISPTPRQTEFTPFEQLRSLARNYYGIGLCLEVHNRIIQRLEPQFTPRPGVVPEGEDATSPKWIEPARRMADWLEEGPNAPFDGWDLHGWLAAFHRDLMEVDAAAVYHKTTRGGYLLGLRLVDATTIQALTDIVGEIPQPPAAAYRQVLYGAPGDAFTALEMDYLRYTTRTDSLYGTSPVERILLTVNQALRKQSFDLRRFTDGATPSGLLTTDNLNINWTPDQMRRFEQEFNNILAGNDALRARTKSIPPGWKFQQTQAEVISTEFDMFLLTVCGAAFGVTKDEMGFTDTSNRSVGDSQENVTYRNAIKPRSDFLARYISRLCRRYDGTPLQPHDPTVSRAGSPTRGKGMWDARYVMTWGGIEEPDDFSAKATSINMLFQSGILTRLQAKHELDLPVEKGEEDTPAFAAIQGGMDGIVVLGDIDANRDLQQQAREIKVQTAAAGLHVQADQGKELDQQVQQGQEQDQFGGEEGEGDVGDENQSGSGGETTPPDDTPPSAPSGGGSSAANSDTSGNTDTGSASSANGTSDSSTSDSSQTPDDAEKAVDDLIAKAKGKQAKRLNESEDQRNARTDSRESRGDAYGAPDLGSGPGSRTVVERVRDALGDVARDGGRSAETTSNDPQRREPLVARGSGSHQDTVESSHAPGNDADTDNDLPGANQQRDNFTVISAAAATDIRHAISDIVAQRGRGFDNGDTGRRDAGTGADPVSETAQPQALDASLISDEWARYHEKALRSVKRGKPVPAFVSDILPGDEHAWVADQLMTCATADEVRAVFAQAREAEAVAVTPVQRTACPHCGVHEDAAQTRSWLPDTTCSNCGGVLSPLAPTPPSVEDEQRAMVADMRATLAEVRLQLRQDYP